MSMLSLRGAAASFSTLMVLAWLAPDHYPPWTAFHSDWLAAMAVAIHVFVAVLLTRKAGVPIPLPALAAAAVAAIPVLQWSVGQIHFAGDALLAGLYLLGLSFAIYAGFTAQRCTGRLVEPLMWAFAFAASLSAIIALCQWLRVDGHGILMMGMSPTGRPYANFAQPNQLATFLMMGLVSACLLFHWRRLTSFTLGVLAVLLCVGVALTQSRAAWLEMAGLVAWLLGMRRRAQLRFSYGAVLSLGAMFLVFVLVLPFLSELLYLSSRGTEQQMRPGTRPIHWATVLDAIGIRPWIGYGWNQVSVAISHAAANRPASHEMIEHSHNLVLDLLIWNGVPLGIAIISGVAWWLWRCARTCRDATSAMILAVIGMPLLHSMVEFPLEYAYMLFPVGFLVGTLEASRDRIRAIRVPRGAIAVLATAATVMVAWIGVEYMRVEENTRLLRFEAAGIGALGVESSAPDVVLLTQQREFLRFARTEAKPDMSTDELDWMRRVAERYGYPPVLFRYALAAGLNGRPEVAADALVRLCKIHPAALCGEARMNWVSLIDGPFPELKNIPAPAPE